MHHGQAFRHHLRVTIAPETFMCCVFELFQFTHPREDTLGLTQSHPIQVHLPHIINCQWDHFALFR